MAGTRITNLQNAVKQVQLSQLPQHGAGTQGAVQMRIKNPQSSGDRLSQSKSMVLQDSDLPQKPLSRHRRNQSQHGVVVTGAAALQPMVDLKSEHLNVAKISENGKKQRKNWSSMWTVLTSDELLLYKDKQETNVKAGGKTDVVQLCGAVIDWTTEKSSKKNVFQITTNTGSEYLIQSDNYSTASKWYDAIRKTVDSSTKEDQSFALRRSNSTEYLSRHTSLPGYGSASSNTKQRNPVHRRSINRVFGCHLLTLCEREGTTVPKFVKTCLDTVEKRGLEADGIYRVSGNLATIQKLRFIVDQEEDLDLDDSQWEDIHVITGALKMFFRELPEPLFPFRFFQQFVEVVQLKESKQKIQEVKKLIQQLPKPNHDTMKMLFSHLQRVLAFSQKNLMSTQGISIVFGPTLMWPELDAGNMAVNMVYQNQIMEFILIESQEIFNLDRK
ncbi:rho GTPase-activating protein 15 isoform X2 [Kryptolebias marmoratus]|uniref:rho GTPase-activating protein 15 isoform X2 n=1 Tax=Kryptolebias marmoratus TaxID=37003 RepID=UPI0007F8CCAE|nr:rho GTPase-activating protein 15 isoform X2 [Kryptolebias marmoratus]